MALKPSGNKDELCYPFIHEASHLCDFEIATDELCNHVGMILAHLPENHTASIADLDQLQPLIYHLNGSIRGRLALNEKDLDWLHSRYLHYQTLTQGRVKGFVLPRGPMPVPLLHLARSSAKKAIRCMVRIDQEGIPIPDLLPRFCNLLCNYFFVLALYINQQIDFTEVPFVSKSYGASK